MDAGEIDDKVASKDNPLVFGDEQLDLAASRKRSPSLLVVRRRCTSRRMARQPTTVLTSPHVGLPARCGHEGRAIRETRGD